MKRRVSISKSKEGLNLEGAMEASTEPIRFRIID